MRGLNRMGAVVAGLAAVIVISATATAQADEQHAHSQPNEDISAFSGSGAASGSDRDKDGDFNTVTQADVVRLNYAVFNRTDFAQTVHVRVELDGPGTAQDAVLVDEDVSLGLCQEGSVCTDGTQNNFEFRVKRKDWPAGSYTLTVTGSGSETATAVSTFTVHYEK